jgi:hypothetical protein
MDPLSADRRQQSRGSTGGMRYLIQKTETITVFGGTLSAVETSVCLKGMSAMLAERLYLASIVGLFIVLAVVIQLVAR